MRPPESPLTPAFITTLTLRKAASARARKARFPSITRMTSRGCRVCPATDSMQAFNSAHRSEVYAQIMTEKPSSRGVISDTTVLSELTQAE